MSAASPRLLQICNLTLGGGGEDLAVTGIARLLRDECEFRECLFHSADWTGPNAPPKWQQAIWLWRNPRAIHEILRVHRELRADVWILHNFVPVVSAGVYAAARKAGVPIIQFAHNFRPFSLNSYLWCRHNLDIARWRSNFLREIAIGSWRHSRLKTSWLALTFAMLHWRNEFRGVKAWVAVSDFVRRKFVEAGLPPENVFALRHFWTPLEPEPEARDDGHYLFLGRLIEEKGVKVLVQAWDIVAQQLGSHTPRLVIGGDGLLAGWVDNAARRNPRIEYRGVVGGEAKRELLAGCRALIAPSIWWEPLGLVVYEAYDFAKPVLGARSGGMAELIQSGQTGFLHAPGATAELAQQVISLDRDEGQRRRFGSAGRAWLIANARGDEWKRSFFQIVDHATAQE